jgi:hypothetical protein
MLLATGSIVYLLAPQPWGGAALGVFTFLGLAELVAWFVLERRSRGEAPS